MTPNSTENMAESVETRGSCDNSSSCGSGSFYHTGLWLAYVTRGCQQKLLCTPWAGRKWGRRGGCLFHFSSLRVERMANRFVRVLSPPFQATRLSTRVGELWPHSLWLCLICCDSKATVRECPQYLQHEDAEKLGTNVDMLYGNSSYLVWDKMLFLKWLGLVSSHVKTKTLG